MPTLRRLKSHEWRAYRDVRLRALRDAPESFGSTLEAEEARSDAAWEERVSSRASAPSDLPLVIEDKERFVGLAWGRINPAEPDTARLFQMWVAPTHRAAGHGIAMLRAVMDWARDSGARRLVLQVTCGNEAAERLYEGAGFVEVGAPGRLRPDSDLLSRTMQLDL